MIQSGGEEEMSPAHFALPHFQTTAHITRQSGNIARHKGDGIFCGEEGGEFVDDGEVLVHSMAGLWGDFEACALRDGEQCGFEVGVHLLHHVLNKEVVIRCGVGKQCDELVGILNAIFLWCGND